MGVSIFSDEIDCVKFITLSKATKEKRLFFLDVASLVRDAIKQMIEFNLVVSLDRPMNHMYVKNIKICLSILHHA